MAVKKQTAVEETKEKKALYYGTGRRKTAVAKVWVYPGQGKIWVNGKMMEPYFQYRPYLRENVLRPLILTGTQERYNVRAKALGGGIPAQAFAVRMGIARALLELNPEFRSVLKKEGMLRRDPREKERKKYGHKRARKSFQYSKR